mmetsp:Transcript_3452/g.4637  ORF Transcript_3452/g.4637 Transcript_3452/m.4637 type:complete len:100 (-) Transcript_3452:1634-1933(-)
MVSFALGFSGPVDSFRIGILATFYILFSPHAAASSESIRVELGLQEHSTGFLPPGFRKLNMPVNAKNPGAATTSNSDDTADKLLQQPEYNVWNTFQISS